MERAYAITSLPPEQADAARLLEIWRGYWRIENRLHWVRDVVFGEDLSQVRTGGAATAGGVAQPIHRCAAAEWGEKHIGDPATLRLEGLGDPVVNRPTPTQLKDPAVVCLYRAS